MAGVIRHKSRKAKKPFRTQKERTYTISKISGRNGTEKMLKTTRSKSEARRIFIGKLNDPKTGHDFIVLSKDLESGSRNPV